ncbi:MAG: biotin attachment protein [Candidatus Rokubacteria bacterium]|nr:biotin attachment protein [Candidatus Rokubacteria bacterium]
MKYAATVSGRTVPVEITGDGGRYRVVVDGEVFEVDARRAGAGAWSLLLGGTSWLADVTEHAGTTVVDVGGEEHTIAIEEATRYTIRTHGGAGGAHGAVLTAPLPGKITHVAVKPGDEVKPGDTLLVIEAMKMENEFRAGTAGRVVEVRVAAGQAVNAGDVLVVID